MNEKETDLLFAAQIGEKSLDNREWSFSGHSSG